MLLYCNLTTDLQLHLVEAELRLKEDVITLKDQFVYFLADFEDYETRFLHGFDASGRTLPDSSDSGLPISAIGNDSVNQTDRRARKARQRRPARNYQGHQGEEGYRYPPDRRGQGRYHRNTNNGTRGHRRKRKANNQGPDRHNNRDSSESSMKGDSVVTSSSSTSDYHRPAQREVPSWMEMPQHKISAQEGIAEASIDIDVPNNTVNSLSDVSAIIKGADANMTSHALSETMGGPLHSTMANFTFTSPNQSVVSSKTPSPPRQKWSTTPGLPVTRDSPEQCPCIPELSDSDSDEEIDVDELGQSDPGVRPDTTGNDVSVPLVRDRPCGKSMVTENPTGYTGGKAYMLSTSSSVNMTYSSVDEADESTPIILQKAIPRRELGMRRAQSPLIHGSSMSDSGPNTSRDKTPKLPVNTSDLVLGHHGSTDAYLNGSKAASDSELSIRQRTPMKHLSCEESRTSSHPEGMDDELAMRQHGKSSHNPIIRINRDTSSLDPDIRY